MENKDAFSTKHIDVLDGIRAISVIIVLIFHFWQQTWIFPTIKTPFLFFLGLERLDFTPLARVGYLFVDMMILISGFLLFLPVARNVFYGDPIEKDSVFFKKRAIRILPSYLLCITLLFVYELAMGGYGKPISWKTAFGDLILHLLFLQTWTTQSYLATKLNVVLWTLAVEVWFYILFPVIKAIVMRRPKENNAAFCIFRASVVFAVMILISAAYIYGYVLNSGSAFSNSVDSFLTGIRIGSVQVGIRSDYLSMVINQLPAFMGLYSVGILGSMLYIFLAGKLKKKWWIGLISTALAFFFIWLMAVMIKDCASKQSADAQVWQMTERLKLAFVYMGFILSSAFAVKPYRFLLSNKLMVFLSTISYNLYIWHQWLCVKLKYDWRVPNWVGDTPPNQLYTAASDVWKAKYAVIITFAAFLAATLVTYLFERPMSDLLNKRPSIYNGKLNTLFKK